MNENSLGREEIECRANVYTKAPIASEQIRELNCTWQAFVHIVKNMRFLTLSNRTSSAHDIYNFSSRSNSTINILLTRATTTSPASRIWRTLKVCRRDCHVNLRVG